MVDLSKNQQLIAELLVKRQRVHAYEIKKILAGVLGHGSVYQALSAMESKGAVTSEWELPGVGSEGGGPPRKYFTITTLGKDLLEISHARDRATARAERRQKRAHGQ
ncbi:MAG: PadR family transcriptional regulator [Dehalococcoidia bacterium]|nr:PadR family transcriptional regulator [Dehalococcoidia bacterium]